MSVFVTGMATFGHCTSRKRKLAIGTKKEGTGTERGKEKDRGNLPGFCCYSSSNFCAIPMEKKCKKAKWLSGEALQIAVKRREAKSKGDRKDISI